MRRNLKKKKWKMALNLWIVNQGMVSIHCRFIPWVSVYKDFGNYPIVLILFKLIPFWHSFVRY